MPESLTNTPLLAVFTVVVRGRRREWLLHGQQRRVQCRSSLLPFAARVCGGLSNQRPSSGLGVHFQCSSKFLESDSSQSREMQTCRPRSVGCFFLVYLPPPAQFVPLRARSPHRSSRTHPLTTEMSTVRSLEKAPVQLVGTIRSVVPKCACVSMACLLPEILTPSLRALSDHRAAATPAVAPTSRDANSYLREGERIPGPASYVTETSCIGAQPLSRYVA